jgi:hypothetical protein
VEYDEQQAGQLLPHVLPEEIFRAIARLNCLTHIAPARIRWFNLLYIVWWLFLLSVLVASFVLPTSWWPACVSPLQVPLSFVFSRGNIADWQPPVPLATQRTPPAAAVQRRRG